MGKKLKVIIADDELRICNLIEVLGDWAEYEMEIVKITHTGPDTNNAIIELQPDIVLTDISMPGYDGLEIIRKSREREEAIEFIVISGYKHFEYAKTAIKLGVMNYLTKPIEPEELNFSLKETYEMCLNKKNIVLQLNKTTQLEKENKRRKRQEEMSNALKNSSQGFDTTHFKIENGVYLWAILKIDGICGIQDSKHIDGVIKRLLREHLKSFIDWEYIFYEEKFFIWIHHRKENEVSSKLKNIIEDFGAQGHILKDIKITIGTSKVLVQNDQFFEQLIQARQSLNERIMLGCNKVISYNQVKTSAVNLLELLADEFSAIETALEYQNERSLKSALSSIKVKTIRNMHISGSDIKLLTGMLSDLYLSKTKALNLLNHMEAEQFKYQIERIDSLFKAEGILDFLITTIQKSFEDVIKLILQKESRPVLEAKNFIRQHYEKPLTLEYVSQEVGYSTSHISNLFKKTGLNFSEYLQQVRLDHAKKKLRDSQLAVAVICENVGYVDLKHFNKVFKATTGMTPRQYRKLYS